MTSNLFTKKVELYSLLDVFSTITDYENPIKCHYISTIIYYLVYSLKFGICENLDFTDNSNIKSKLIFFLSCFEDRVKKEVISKHLSQNNYFTLYISLLLYLLMINDNNYKCIKELGYDSLICNYIYNILCNTLRKEKFKRKIPFQNIMKRINYYIIQIVSLYQINFSKDLEVENIKLNEELAVNSTSIIILLSIVSHVYMEYKVIYIISDFSFFHKIKKKILNNQNIKKVFPLFVNKIEIIVDCIKRYEELLLTFKHKDESNNEINKIIFKLSLNLTDKNKKEEDKKKDKLTIYDDPIEIINNLMKLYEVLKNILIFFTNIIVEFEPLLSTEDYNFNPLNSIIDKTTIKLILQGIKSISKLDDILTQNNKSDTSINKSNYTKQTITYSVNFLRFFILKISSIINLDLDNNEIDFLNKKIQFYLNLSDKTVVLKNHEDVISLITDFLFILLSKNLNNKNLNLKLLYDELTMKTDFLDTKKIQKDKDKDFKNKDRSIIIEKEEDQKQSISSNIQDSYKFKVFKLEEEISKDTNYDLKVILSIITYLFNHFIQHDLKYEENYKNVDEFKNIISVLSFMYGSIKSNQILDREILRLFKTFSNLDLKESISINILPNDVCCKEIFIDGGINQEDILVETKTNNLDFFDFDQIKQKNTFSKNKISILPSMNIPEFSDKENYPGFLMENSVRISLPKILYLENSYTISFAFYNPVPNTNCFHCLFQDLSKKGALIGINSKRTILGCISLNGDFIDSGIDLLATDNQNKWLHVSLTYYQELNTILTNANFSKFKKSNDISKYKNEIKFYLNGNVSKEYSETNHFLSNSILIIGNSFDFSMPFGAIGYIKIYNKLLSHKNITEIPNNLNENTNKKIISKSLNSYIDKIIQKFINTDNDEMCDDNIIYLIKFFTNMILNGYKEVFLINEFILKMYNLYDKSKEELKKEVGKLLIMLN